MGLQLRSLYSEKYIITDQCRCWTRIVYFCSRVIGTIHGSLSVTSYDLNQIDCLELQDNTLRNYRYVYLLTSILLLIHLFFCSDTDNRPCFQQLGVYGSAAKLPCEMLLVLT